MSGIRVISGSARGRRLEQVSGSGTRPISDRAKEALFNIIGHDVVDSTMLDLFAGTGSVGVEALSRGASRVVFLDTNRKAVRTIRNNLQLTGFGNKCEIFQKDALTYLDDEPQEGFDFVYVAPPQYQGLWWETLLRVDKSAEWLNVNGWIIAQIHPSEFSEKTLRRLALIDRRRYGNTMLCFFAKED